MIREMKRLLDLPLIEPGEYADHDSIMEQQPDQSQSKHVQINEPVRLRVEGIFANERNVRKIRNYLSKQANLSESSTFKLGGISRMQYFTGNLYGIGEGGVLKIASLNNDVQFTKYNINVMPWNSLTIEELQKCIDIYAKACPYDLRVPNHRMLGKLYSEKLLNGHLHIGLCPGRCRNGDTKKMNCPFINFGGVINDSVLYT
jgi:hypothetical protein